MQQYFDKKCFFIFLLQYLFMFLSQYSVQKYCVQRGVLPYHFHNPFYTQAPIHDTFKNKLPDDF